MPDGRVITLTDEHKQCAEPLFNPEMLGKGDDDVIALVNECIERSPEEAREVDGDAFVPIITGAEIWHQELLENLVLCGGTTLLDGFEARLKQGVEDVGYLGTVHADPKRDELVGS